MIISEVDLTTIVLLLIICVHAQEGNSRQSVCLSICLLVCVQQILKVAALQRLKQKRIM